jgi:hypothetical protein
MLKDILQKDNFAKIENDQCFLCVIAALRDANFFIFTDK